ncbi:MAG: hypothetical protein SW019_14330 [Actinomycetota bacterium]|nr:hypothetical protein [Actinomycetota bacterium]
MTARPDQHTAGVLADVRVAVTGADEATVCALRGAGARLVAPTAAEVWISPGPPLRPEPVVITATAAALRTPLVVSATDLDRANRALSALTCDTAAGTWPADVRLAAPVTPRLAVTPDVPEPVRATLAEAGMQVTVLDGDPVRGGTDSLDALVISSRPPPVASGCLVTVRHGPGTAPLTVAAGPFQDAVVLDIAAALAGEPVIEQVWPLRGAEPVELVVFGAHLRGGALTHQLTDLGARWAGELTTAPRYRMSVLATVPAKPAVTRVAAGAPGAALYGQRWVMSAAALGRFLAALPAPMQLGKVDARAGPYRRPRPARRPPANSRSR